MNVLKYWLKNQNVIIANDVLSQINDFAVHVDSSPMMKELALQVMEAISERVGHVRRLLLHSFLKCSFFPFA
jgi:hypothetical protein